MKGRRKSSGKRVSLSAGHADDPRSRPGVELVYRFALELALLAGLAYWGWHLGWTTLTRLLLAALLPMAATAVWGSSRPLGIRAGAVVPPCPYPVRCASSWS